MKPILMVPAGSLKNKPPHGQPCTRCGLCCKATICPLGMHLFRREVGPCPALVENNDGTHQCGVVTDPAKFSIGRTMLHGADALRKATLLLIGSATGCDARFNGEPGDEAFYAKLRQWDREHRSETNKAKKMWGVR